MNPILQTLSQHQFNSPQDAKSQVLSIVDSMTQAQKATFSKMLPVISKVAQAKGVDVSALAELQSRM